MSLLIELPDSSAAPAREEQRKPLKRARDHEQNLLALAPQVAREQPLHGALFALPGTATDVRSGAAIYRRLLSFDADVLEWRETRSRCVWQQSLHDHAESHARDAESAELPGPARSPARAAAGSDAGSDAGGDAAPESPGGAHGAADPALDHTDAARGPDEHGVLATTEQPAPTALGAQPVEALRPPPVVQRSSLARGASITQLGEFVARRVREGSRTLSELQGAPDSAAPSVQRLFVGLLWSATQHNARAVQMEHQAASSAPCQLSRVVVAADPGSNFTDCLIAHEEPDPETEGVGADGPDDAGSESPSAPADRDALTGAAMPRRWRM
jgi:hypothetical protein